MTAHNVDLVYIRRDLGQDLWDRILVRVVITMLCGEVTELARQHANIRGVYVNVQREIDVPA